MKKHRKWQVHFFFGKDYNYLILGWKRVDFGILKIHTMPGEGMALGKEHYDGFLWKFHVWLPFDS